MEQQARKPEGRCNIDLVASDPLVVSCSAILTSADCLGVPATLGEE